MTKLAQFTVRDGQTIWVEVDDGTERQVETYRRVARDKGSELAKTATQSLQSALEAIKPAANEVATTLISLAQKPSRVEVEFGLKLSAEVGAIIASTSAEGHIGVKLIWSMDALASPDTPPASSKP
jgi:hypothetical protein